MEASSRENLISLSDLSADPGERKMIANYHLNQKDDIRREYILRGPVQPQNYNVPRMLIGNRAHKFHPSWFKDYPCLEYSIKKDAVFCLYCDLFLRKANDALINEGFSSGIRNMGWMIILGHILLLTFML